MLNVQNYSHYHKSNKKLYIGDLEGVSFYYLSGCNAAIKSITEKFLYIQIEKKYIDYITEKTKVSLDQILDRYKIFGFIYEYIEIKKQDRTYYIFELSLDNFKTRHTRYYGFCMIRHLYYYQNLLISYLNFSNNLKEKNHIFLLSYLQQIYNVPNTFITWGNYIRAKSFSDLLSIFNTMGNYPRVEYNTILTQDSNKIITLKDIAIYKLKINKIEKIYDELQNNVYILVSKNIKIHDKNCVKTDFFDDLYNDIYIIKNIDLVEDLKKYGLNAKPYTLHGNGYYISVPILQPTNTVTNIFTGEFFYTVNYRDASYFSSYAAPKSIIAHVNMKIVRKDPDIDIVLNSINNQKTINTKLRKQKLIDSVAVTCKKTNLTGKIKLCFGKDLIYISNLSNNPFSQVEIKNVPNDVIEYCKNIWKATTLDIGNIIYDCDLNTVVDIDLSQITSLRGAYLIKSEIKKLIKEKGGIFPIE